MKLNRSIYFLTAILLLGVLLRVDKLCTQGLFFFDEAEMVHKAFLIKNYLATKATSTPIISSGIHSKGLWLMMITLAQKLTGNIPHGAQYASALFGILTLLLTYVLAKRIYPKEAIAAFSMLILSLSSYHIFYSRLGLPETASGFFMLASITSYLIGKKEGMRFIVLAGVLAGCAFLLNRFRVGLLPVFILILEFCCDKGDTRVPWSKRLRFVIYLMCLLIVISAWQSIYWILGILGYQLPGYWESVKGHVLAHMNFQADLFSLLAYPYYIIRFDGWIVLVLLVYSVAFLRKKETPTFFPFAVVFLQMLASSLVDEKGARSISVVLPFIAILCAVSLYHVARWFNAESKRKPLLVMGCLVMAVVSVLKIEDVLSFNSGMPKVMKQINKQFPRARILTTNLPMTSIYSSAEVIHQLMDEKKEDLLRYQAQGYNLVLIDPQKFVSKTFSQFWVLDHTDFVGAIETACPPLLTEKHFNEALLERFLLEHTVHLKETLGFIDQLKPSDGAIRVYSIDACLEQMKNNGKK